MAIVVVVVIIAMESVGVWDESESKKHHKSEPRHSAMLLMALRLLIMPCLDAIMPVEEEPRIEGFRYRIG